MNHCPFGPSLVLCLFTLATWSADSYGGQRWTESKAGDWQQRTGWLVGCNYIPRTAINQLEMWQAETFDPATIDQELGWAAGLGFNSIRVYLHDQLWQQDAEGFLDRVERFLSIADSHGIGVTFVLFDGVWDPDPKLGTQRAPKPRVHNSGWVQSPGREVLGDPGRHDELKAYVVGVVTRFRDDPRIHMWDLFNEADNPNKASYGRKELRNKSEMALALLRKTFAWAREVDPQAPLTTGVWWGDWSSDEKMSEIDRYITQHSDVISFHTYAPLPQAKKRVESLRRFDRPLVCTEYMARGNGSRFDPHLAYFKEQGVGAYSWGLVDGKTQTIYPWDSWVRPYDDEPEEWFHDIFRADGTPYREAEVAFIRKVTGRSTD